MAYFSSILIALLAIGSVSPEGFIEPRYVNDLESSGFFDEMARQYGK